MPEERDPKRVPAAHDPVMLGECVDLLTQAGPGLYLDGTLGAGGHSAALLAANEGVRVLGLDQDRDALDMARRRLESYGDRVFFCPTTFRVWPTSQRSMPRKA